MRRNDGNVRAGGRAEQFGGRRSAAIRRAAVAGMVEALESRQMFYAVPPLIISEFRLRGPSGATDEFVEIYNNSDSPHTVDSPDSSGYALAASDGATRFVVPNGTVIPARGHFLGANSIGYSLSAYAAGDVGYTADIPDNAGIALFNTSDDQEFTLDNRLDAVGSASETNPLYKEGTGYNSLTPFSAEISLFRDLHSGRPADAGNNATDFLFVEPSGLNANGVQRLGAPGPQNLEGPTTGSSPSLAVSLLDPVAGDQGAPNVVRDLTSDPDANSASGTYVVRRTITNVGMNSITSLRFRVTDISVFSASAGVADLRPRDIADSLVTVGGNDVSVYGTTLEQPSLQPFGGGFNSAWVVSSVTPGDPLAPGETIHVQFRVGVQNTGQTTLDVVAETNQDSNSTTGVIHLLEAAVAPTIGGMQANQAVNDNATVAPMANLTIADPDTESMTATVKIAEGVNRGDFTAATSVDAGWIRSVNGNDIAYTRTFPSAANIGSAVQAAVRAMVFQPRSNVLPLGATESTTFTVKVDDGTNPPVSNDPTISTVTTSVNDAPVLDVSLPLLPSVYEDVAAGGGQSVASFVGDSISDTDPDALTGIAITKAKIRNTGKWEFSTDGGANWQDIGSPSLTSALLLRPTDLVRFSGGQFEQLVHSPGGGGVGTPAYVGPSLSYKAWDQTDGGTAGTTVDATVNGGSSSFSTSTDVATVRVLAYANTPTVSNSSTLAGLKTTGGLVVTRNAIDGDEVTHYKVTGITGGSLFLADGVTPVAEGTFVAAADAETGFVFAADPGTGLSTAAGFDVQASTSGVDAGLGGSAAHATVTVLPNPDPSPTPTPTPTPTPSPTPTPTPTGTKRVTRVPGQPVTVSSLAVDAAHGAVLAVSVVSNPAGGTVSVNDNGTPGDASDDSITYTPTAGFNADDVFTYALTTADAGVVNVNIDVQVRGAAMDVDPTEPTKQALFIATDDDDDVIVLDRRRGRNVNVNVNTVDNGTFSSTTRIVISGGAGNDQVIVRRGRGTAAAVQFFGEDGDDTLSGGRKGDVLIGGPGNDTLIGTKGRDVLIGGGGADTIRSSRGGGRDLLIAGTTDYDGDTESSRQALADLMAVWTGPGSYASRVARITGTAGVGTSGARFDATTVHDDDVADLIGGRAGDVIFARTTGANADQLENPKSSVGLIEI